MELSERLAELCIDPAVERAETPPGWLYTAPECWERGRAALAQGWHFAGSGAPLQPGELDPFTLLPDVLGEPLVLVRQGETLRCLSNVCTHRAMLVVRERAKASSGLRCGYHGRRFELDGRFRSMPEFEGAEGFPRPCDDLPALPVEALGPLAFTSLEPSRSFADWLGPLRDRLEFFPWDELRFDAEGARAYEVGAHWALYVENYLEGLHIPFVHPALNQALDFGGYRTELLAAGTLQVGRGEERTPCFELPAGHPDAGQRVAAYYAWLFPTTMLNLYPWGLSLNVVEPLGPARTRVRFLPFVARPEFCEQGAGAALHQTELEDEAVVEAVQRGVRSRLYRRGRYSPRHERGVHHFHRLLLDAMRGAPSLQGAS